jgi:putative ABC transport system substrate-binding protein
MRRRKFITLLGGAAAASSVPWPRTARTQQGNQVRRIGILTGQSETDPTTQPRVSAFKKGLEALGWTEGRNVRIDYRGDSNYPDRHSAHAAELVGMAPDVILSSPPGMKPLLGVTRTIPIVFVLAIDPIAEGFVKSLARPGGNVTGFAAWDPSNSSKHIELLKEVSPNVARVMFIYNPIVPGITKWVDVIAAAAPSFGVEAKGAAVSNAADIEQSITALALEPNGGLIVPSNPVINENLELIHAVTRRHRLPAIGVYRFFPARGGLMSYGISDVDQFRRSTSYVDRILKGQKPADLPVQYPTT